MNKYCFLVATALCAQVLWASPDLSAPHYAALRESFLKESAAIDAAHKTDVAKTLERHLKDATQREIRAKVSGNASARADASQLVKLLTDATAAFEKDGTFAFPDKIRPANAGVVSLCLQAQRNAARAADDAKSILLGTSRESLRKFLEAEGLKPTANVLDSYWASLLAAGPAGAQPGEAAGAASAPRPAEDGGEATVYATSRAGRNWRPLARIDIATSAMEMFEIPLFPMEAGKTAVRGTGMAGTKWLAFLSAPRAAGEPKTAAAFRLKSIEGKDRIDVMTWPSRANGWVFELRARPSGATSGNACLIEIGD